MVPPPPRPTVGGDFYFEGPKEGTYQVEIKANGKTKVFEAVSTKENSANLGDIAL